MNFLSIANVIEANERSKQRATNENSLFILEQYFIMGGCDKWLDYHSECGILVRMKMERNV
jgi:hypothetical protein